EDAAALETALYLVLNHLQKSHLLNIFDSLQILFVKLQSESINDAKSSNKKKKRKENLYKNMVNFRRVVMTPTRIVFLPNQPFKQTLFCHGPPENANENDDTCTLYRADYTIRAVIRNDDFELLPFTLNHKAIPGLQKLRDWEKENSISFKNRMQLEKLESKDKLANEIQDNFLNKCIKDRIKGLKIQNRTYEYLGSSTSQLRNYGLYLYARDCKNETASDIRKSLGNINERNVAKFVARVGLALSEVQYFIDLSEFEKNGSRIVRMIPDIKGGPNQEYIFSDGVGMISLTLATKIYEKLKHTRLMVNLEGPPSAFQIRLGGCKGLLVINPHLEGHQILIREESMRKYDSENMSLLGILKVSGISSVHLNRPFVTLLDQLGADRNYMCELLSENLKQLSKAFVTEGKAKNIILDHSNLHHEIDISLLAYAGITFLNEPFFRECLEAIITNNVRYLREKARIKIPREYGRTMFGVLDDINVYNENQLSNKSETQRFFLRENQVFIQISDANNPKEKKVITGPVMVTKFPCMHPGDIRIFEAFDIPELHHIVDCIVFPAVGKRPLPDQMAGSDLDGDEYAVVWNSKLFTFKNCKAMDYSPAKDVSSRNPLYLDRDVEVSDMIEFYNYYIKNYSVGRIASAHLAWADSKENGIFDPICINLAKKYAVSLDFAKTGINEILAQDEIVPAYPDFMEKHAIKNFYMSKRILGDLYRQIRLVELGLVEDLPVHSKTFCNQLLVHKDWKRYEDSAESAYQKYASLMKNLQNQFKIDSESALILGFPDKWSKLCISCEKTRELGYKVQQLVKNLFSIIRQDFEEEFDENKARDFREEKLAKASAYYMVTFHSKTKIKYFGLPWIFSKYLSQLGISKRGDVNRRFNEKELTIMLMNAIDEHCKCDSEDDIIQSVQHLFDNWISSQQVINFGLHISKQLIKTEINKQIDLHWHLFINSGETNSPGKFVLKILSKFAKRVIYLDKKYSKDSTNEDSKEINGTHKFLGIYSFITLNKMYRTKSVDCFIVNYVPFQQNISFMRYCLSFAHKRELKDFIAKNEDKFKKVLMQISVVECAFGRWFEDGNYYSYYLTAFGSKCAIETLNIVVAKFLNEPELIKLLYH
ncbi:RNA-dependent RNA polymerase 1-like protein, partial [Dinothrombium tinctorium]